MDRPLASPGAAGAGSGGSVQWHGCVERKHWTLRENGDAAWKLGMRKYI